MKTKRKTRNNKQDHNKKRWRKGEKRRHKRRGETRRHGDTGHHRSNPTQGERVRGRGHNPQNLIIYEIRRALSGIQPSRFEF